MFTDSGAAPQTGGVGGRLQLRSLLRKHLQRHGRTGKVQRTGFKRPYESSIHLLATPSTT